MVALGWWGEILRVDLSRNAISKERLDEVVLSRFVGGRGLGAKLVYDEVDPKADPLGIENRLVFAAGPLSGTRAPTSGRFSASFKSPLTGLITDCNCGGFFGPWIKKAGYDAIVIQGTSDEPCYLSVSDQGCDIFDAGDFWGMGTFETDKVLEKKHGGKVACIGPAGECGGLISSVIVNGRRALGRGGIGAVMGSKKLKALVVAGKKKVLIQDEKRFERAVGVAKDLIKGKINKGWSLPAMGTPSIFHILNAEGMLPVKNFQESEWPFEKADLVSGERLRQDFISGKQGCYMCPIICGHKVTLPDGNEMKSPEFETLWSFGPDLDNSDLESIVKAGALCDDYGLDTISTGATIASAIELVELGKLKADLGWNDPEKVLQLISKIAHMEGIGQELAEGSKRLCERYGAPETSMSSKGLELPAYDPRGAQGMGLAYATSNRGACHMRAYTALSELRGKPNRFKTEGKAELVINMQDRSAFEDSLVLCRFVQPILTPKISSELYAGAVGIDFSVEDLMETGGRIYNLERLFNLKAGSQKDDLPPRMREPIGSGPSFGQAVEIEWMLVEYRKLRGWSESGIERETLRRYGLL